MMAQRELERDATSERRRKREGERELVLERIIWMSNTTPRAPTHTSMEVPCAQQLCLIRRIVLAATGSLYTPVQAHTGNTHTRGRRAYTGRYIRSCVRARWASLFLLCVFLPFSPFFLSFFFFLFLFFPTASVSTTENCIIMRPGQWGSGSVKLPYANLAAEAVMISMRRNREPAAEGGTAWKSSPCT